MANPCNRQSRPLDVPAPLGLLLLAALLLAAGCATAPADSRPNIILVMTDDQGYGEVGAHGNSMIRTPHLDALHAESVRLTNFHVDPHLLADQIRSDHWTILLANRRLAHDHGAFDRPPRGNLVRRRALGRRLRDWLLRQVAPGRQLALPPDRPRLPRGRLPRRWRRRPDARLLGQ